MSELTVREVGQPGGVAIVPEGAGRDAKSRLGKFKRWLKAQGLLWHTPELARYRDALLSNGLKASSVGAHLATVRGRYRAILKDNATRDVLYSDAVDWLAEVGKEDSPANRKAVVEETLTRLENAVDPRATRVTVPTKQDRADSEEIRLTAEQASALLAAPGVDTLRGVRDSALIAVLLCTGVREAELCGLDVADLRQELGGELALWVRRGKGNKWRLVPYGELSWVLAIVDKWLQAAGIEEGAVFRGFYKGGRVRSGRLAVRTVGYILGGVPHRSGMNGYPLMIGGTVRTVRPHDLRRTYARRLYDAGLPLAAIQQNLGHASVETTLGYIGELDAEQRRPPSIYTFDLAGLEGVAVQGRMHDRQNDRDKEGA